MIETIATLIGGLCFVGLILCCWAMYANEKTFRQELRILDYISEQADYDIALRKERRHWYQLLHSVPRHAHFWANFFLKDWKKVYPKEIQDIITDKS